MVGSAVGKALGATVGVIVGAWRSYHPVGPIQTCPGDLPVPPPHPLRVTTIPTVVGCVVGSVVGAVVGAVVGEVVGVAVGACTSQAAPGQCRENAII